ncbi:MAG: ankyrin repeat domain-containing protein [Rhodospirillaceae bacterium]
MKLPPAPLAEVSARLSGTFKQSVTLGIEAVVRYHLKNGQNVDSRDEMGRTPLIIAAAKGHTKICSILLEAGANPDIRDCSGFNALDTAIHLKRSGVWELLQRFLKKEPPAPTVSQVSVSEPIVPRAPEVAPVVVVDIDVVHDYLDLSGWQPEVDLPPPPPDPLVLPAARSAQRKLGEHIPIDLDVDWSDVEITLPELIARRRRHRDNEEESRWLGDASNLILAALRDGEIPESFVGNITPVMGDDGNNEGLPDYDAILRMTLGDLGVRIGDDEGSRIIFDGADVESEESYSAELGPVDIQLH